MIMNFYDVNDYDFNDTMYVFTEDQEYNCMKCSILEINTMLGNTWIPVDTSC